MKLPVIGLSDTPLTPSGFGKVARKMFMPLPQGLFRLAHLGRGYPGTCRYPGVQCYGYEGSGPREDTGQTALPRVINDFAPDGPFALWTLMDPWQTSWIGTPKESPVAHPLSTRYLTANRQRMTWVGYFTCDAMGPRNGPPRWVEGYLDSCDVPVMMSEWARKLCQPFCKKELRFIPHGVSDTFHPDDQAACRDEWDRKHFKATLKSLSREMGEANPEALMAESHKSAFTLGDRFTVLSVMANRERKYWPTLLKAFRMLVDKVPNARFIGVCGLHRTPDERGWDLPSICKDLGLRTFEEGQSDPNVWLIGQIGTRSVDEDDDVIRKLNAIANVTAVISGGEGSGMPQLEAHACGRPCVVGKYSASTEQVVDDREGVLPRGFMTVGQNESQRPLYRAEDIADRFLYAYKNPGWCREVGAAGVEQAERLRWHKIIPQWVDVFTGVADRVMPQAEEAIATPA